MDEKITTLKKVNEVLKEKKLIMEFKEDRIEFINIAGKVIKTTIFDDIRFPKPDFKKCTGLIPLPKYVNYDDPDNIGQFTSVAARLTKFGCRSCPDRELCLKLREISIWDMIGAPGEGK